MRTRGLEAKVLRLMNQANRDYNMITEGDRILVALSGGKDSRLDVGTHPDASTSTFSFDLVAFHPDQGQPGYDGSPMRRHMEKLEAEFEFLGKSKPRIPTPELWTKRRPQLLLAVLSISTGHSLQSCHPTQL